MPELPRDRKRTPRRGTARPASRKIDRDDGTNRRTAILVAATQVLQDEGYAALTSRRIAKRAGLKSKLVHYYFASMEEIVLTVYRTAEDQYYERQAKALVSANPLRSLWEFNSDSYNTKVLQELIALASHHESLRQEIARASQRSRTVQAIAFERAIGRLPKRAPNVPSQFLSLLMTATALSDVRMLGAYLTRVSNL
jgi:AcrR family transcriptional regulator